MTEETEPEPGVDPEAPETTGPLTLPDEEREAADPTTALEPDEEEGEAAETGDDEQAETNAPAEEGLEGEEPPPAEPGNLSAQTITPEEIEKRYKALDGLRAHVAKRIGVILEEDANDLIPCPLCVTVAPGWMYPPNVVALEEQQLEALRLLLGLRNEGELSAHPAFKQCDACHGYGRVKTGSERMEYRYADCPTCASLGYRQDLSGQIIPNGTQPTPDQPVITGPTVIPDELPPELAHYKEQGWLIAPPMVTT